jgi:DNA-directed RNA polymerase subunit RPC12/RpoP
MKLRTYEFDDDILPQERVRFHVLRTLDARKYHGRGLVEKLLKKQKNVCPECGEKIVGQVHIDHKKTVKQFADDVDMPLYVAYEKCRMITNMRVLHPKWNQARNRKNKKG